MIKLRGFLGIYARFGNIDYQFNRTSSFGHAKLLGLEGFLDISVANSFHHRFFMQLRNKVRDDFNS